MAKVVCQICQCEFSLITNSHLKKIHNTTPDEYLINFPGAVLYYKEMHEHITAILSPGTNQREIEHPLRGMTMILLY
jgi:hypothetical protein